MLKHLDVGFTGKNPHPAYAPRWGNNIIVDGKYKINIDYAITIISASDFYITNTSVSPDEDLITIDATSSTPSTLFPPCRCMGL
jgi:hypothetical protein